MDKFSELVAEETEFSANEQNNKRRPVHHNHCSLLEMYLSFPDWEITSNTGSFKKNLEKFPI